ncbi:MAG: DUF2752 domain-containing protein [Acidimicrobiales bacterium]|nr:DUF2752 domain-containing protein [Acidimicrobiales bacterium]
MTTAVRVDLRDLRILGGLMLAAAVARGLTHSSIGLPCPLRAMTGIPCPLCGMTTSVTAAATGRVVDAIVANPAGLVAVIVALLLVLRPRVQSVDLPRWALPAGLAAMWLWQLFRFQLV